MRKAHHSLTLALAAALALSLAACGRRGSLEAPSGAMPNAPDVTTRQPRQKPPEVTPADAKTDGDTAEPKPKPAEVQEKPAP